MFLCSICLLSILAQSPVREMPTQAVAVGNERVPWFRHGHVVTFRGRGPYHGFAAYGPDGKLTFDKSFELPGSAGLASVGDVDFDANGNAAVAASATGSTACGLHGVLLLDGTGLQIRFIDTGCYIPGHVSIAPDHTIWTLGWQRDAGGVYEDREDYMIVRHYNLEGKQLDAFLPRSAFPKGLTPGSPGGPVSIAATAERIGVLCYSGTEGSKREWVELDMSGKAIRRVRLDGNQYFTAVFTADHRVYADANPGLVRLDAVTQTWKPVAQQGPALFGADGNKLVYRNACCGPIQLQWFEQP